MVRTHNISKGKRLPKSKPLKIREKSERKRKGGLDIGRADKKGPEELLGEKLNLLKGKILWCLYYQPKIGAQAAGDLQKEPGGGLQKDLAPGLSRKRRKVWHVWARGDGPHVCRSAWGGCKEAVFLRTRRRKQDDSRSIREGGGP